MKKILYRPNLKLPKRYDTDGYIEPYRESISYNEESSITKEDELEQLAEDILSLQQVVTQLPDEMKPSINTMLNTLQFVFIQIDEDYLPEKNHANDSNSNSDSVTDIKDEADLVITTPDSVEDDDDSTTDDKDKNNFLFSNVVPKVKIKTIPKDKIKLINKKYCVTLLEITKDYINELKKATNQYFMDMAMIMMEHEKMNIDFLDKKYTYKTTDLQNKDLQHVSDFIIKSQIVRDQKQRMMNKLINEEESLNKIKACEVARELSIRYAKEDYRKNTVYHDLFSNISLKESRLSYEQKLDNNLYELYKYMNSSVILLDECLRLYMREAQAKSILIKEEGIKL